MKQLLALFLAALALSFTACSAPSSQGAFSMQKSLFRRETGTGFLFAPGGFFFFPLLRRYSARAICVASRKVFSASSMSPLSSIMACMQVRNSAITGVRLVMR